ncbi:MAG: recombinase family protein [Lachnospiraceae bacterium]|nr:recombinase family protein [Lachnospiraceae bacterium]
MEKFGYIRVSSKDQNPDRQYAALASYHIPKKNIYVDRMSGKDFQRNAYQKMMKKVRRGDLIIIKSIDRLGRNYDDIMKEWRRITKEIGADFEVVDMPLLNTRSREDNLTGVFISDLVLQILAYVAETERAFIKSRQAEGIAVAKAKGVRFGCQKKEMPEKFEQYYLLWKQGRISTRQAAVELGMSHSTFYRRCKERGSATEQMM